MTGTNQLDPTSGGPRVLRIIPITKPGISGCSFAVARNDEEEAAVRTKARTQGCIAGPAMQPQPNPDFWKMVDHINNR